MPKTGAPARLTHEGVRWGGYGQISHERKFEDECNAWNIWERKRQLPRYQDADEQTAKEMLIEEELAYMSGTSTWSPGGWYQWRIFILAGFGYFLDLAWAQVFSLSLAQAKTEFGISEDESTHMYLAFAIGLAVGCLVWGWLVDIGGRRVVFNATVFCTAISGLAIPFVTNFNSICVLAAFCGFGAGGNIPVDTLICFEFLSKRKRAWVAGLNIFQPLGVVICSMLAWYFFRFNCLDTMGKEPLQLCDDPQAGEPCIQHCSKEDIAGCCGTGFYSNMKGWRYLILCIDLLTWSVFLSRALFFQLHESPKFLVSQNRTMDAVWTIQRISLFNGEPDKCRLSTVTIHELELDYVWRQKQVEEDALRRKAVLALIDAEEQIQTELLTSIDSNPLPWPYNDDLHANKNRRNELPKKPSRRARATARKVAKRAKKEAARHAKQQNENEHKYFLPQEVRPNPADEWTPLEAVEEYTVPKVSSFFATMSCWASSPVAALGSPICRCATYVRHKVRNGFSRAFGAFPYGRDIKKMVKGNEWFTFCLCAVYACDFWGFSISGSVVPYIYAEKIKDPNASARDELNRTYEGFLIVFLAGGLPSIMIATYWSEVYRDESRKLLMVVSAIGMCVGFALFDVAKTWGAYTTFFFLEFFFQSILNTFLYAWTPEAYAAEIRGTAAGFTAGVGRVFAVIAAGSVGPMMNSKLEGPLWAGCAGLGVCAVLIMLLPGRRFRDDEVYEDLTPTASFVLSLKTLANVPPIGTIRWIWKKCFQRRPPDTFKDFRITHPVRRPGDPASEQWPTLNEADRRRSWGTDIQ